MGELASSTPSKEQNLRRILWFNLACDVEDPSLGFAMGWVNEIARRCEHVDVLTVRRGRFATGAGVTVQSLGKERGFGRTRLAVGLYPRLAQLLRRNRYDAAFAHMAGPLAVLAAPLLKLYAIPLVLWYVHPHADWRLKLAHAAATRVVSCYPSSYPLGRDKLEIIGHGIDTSLFRPGPQPETTVPTVLCAGRISRSKNLDVLVRAASRLAHLTPRLRVVILGSPLTASDQLYFREIQALVSALGLGDIVHIHSAVPWETMPDWYRQGRVHVNLTPSGFGDKAPLEAMSCGRPSIVGNPELRETLGRYADRLIVNTYDPGEWADKIHAALGVDDETLRGIGAYLRARVVADHGLERLGRRLAALMADLSHSRRTPVGAGRREF